MSTTERNASLDHLMKRITTWEENGTLDNLDRLLHFVNAALDSMTPEIIDGLVNTIVQVVEVGDQVLQSKVFKLAPTMIEETEQTLSSPPQHTKHEFRHMYQQLKDPEVQDGLELIIGLLRTIGREVHRYNGTHSVNDGKS